MKIPKMPKTAENILVGIIVMIMSPMLLLGFVFFCLLWLKCAAIGPSKSWRKWFAWHPVNVGDSFDPDWRWLEIIERQSYGIACNTNYRLTGRGNG